MEISKNNNVTFAARLTTAPYSGKKLGQYLKDSIVLFEKQTKDKPGCMTLREDIVSGDYFFWNSKTAPRCGFSTSYRLVKYDQRAMTTKDFLKHLILEKTPQEQADIFESIFDALQVIPKKIKKAQKNDASFMTNLNEQIEQKLGKHKDMLISMFEHITSIPTGKKNLKLEDIDF